MGKIKHINSFQFIIEIESYLEYAHYYFIIIIILFIIVYVHILYVVCKIIVCVIFLNLYYFFHILLLFCELNDFNRIFLLLSIPFIPIAY